MPTSPQPMAHNPNNNPPHGTPHNPNDDRYVSQHKGQHNAKDGQNGTQHNGQHNAAQGATPCIGAGQGQQQPDTRWNEVDNGAEVTAHAVPNAPVNNSVPVGEGQGPVSNEFSTLNPPSLDDIDAPAGHSGTSAAQAGGSGNAERSGQARVGAADAPSRNVPAGATGGNGWGAAEQIQQQPSVGSRAPEGHVPPAGMQPMQQPAGPGIQPQLGQPPAERAGSEQPMKRSVPVWVWVILVLAVIVTALLVYLRATGAI